MNKSKTGLLRICLLALILIIGTSAIAPGGEAYASVRNKKAYTYETVLKHGSTVYCMVGTYDENSVFKNIYEIDLKTSKKQKLVTGLSRPGGMEYKKGYLYFVEHSGEARLAGLYRIKADSKTGKYKFLGDIYDVHDGKHGAYYYLGKKNILYRQVKLDEKTLTVLKTKRKQMRLNGKHKRKSKYNVKPHSKQTNAKGYTLYYDGYDYDYDSRTYSYYKIYLKKPDGKRVFIVDTKYMN